MDDFWLLLYKNVLLVFSDNFLSGGLVAWFDGYNKKKSVSEVTCCVFLMR